MPDSIYSDADLILISKMDDAMLGRFLGGMSARQALTIRRNLQISLAHYSKKFPARKKLDLVHGSTLLICRKIERAVRDAYTLQKWRKIKAQFPRLSEREKIEKKNEIKANFEKFIAANSY